MIVVTGGAGFIGSNLVAGLAERGVGDIAVCDRFAESDKSGNLAKHRVAARIEPVDLAEYLADNANAIAAVFHMGAISSTTETDTDLLATYNVNPSLMLWDWCIQHRRPLIYASSAATYGDGSQGFDDDGTSAALARLQPLNDYGRSKHEVDCHIARQVEAGAPTPPQWAGLKFFNVYGPNEYHKGGMRSVAVQIYEAVAAGQPARLFRSHRPDVADGEQLRDFVWVGDCVDVMLWLLDNPGVSGLFNMGTGKARSFADLVKAVFAALDRAPDIEFIDTPEAIRAKYQYFTQANMARLRQAGYTRPFIELEDGVTRYVRDYLAPEDRYR
jgi:ADP-L-glycero-D-manno-heptose 6-epimerase